MSDSKGQQDPSSPEEPGRRPGERGFTGQGEALGRELWKEVRGGVEHFHLRGGSRPPGRLRQFFHGMSLPFHLAGALLKDPVARRLYLRVGLLQTLAALVLALTCMGSGKEAVEGVSREESRAEDEARAKALRKVAADLADQHLEAAEARAARRILEGGAAPGERAEEDSESQPHEGDPAAAEQPPPSRRKAAAALAQDLEDAGRPARRSRAEARAEANARLQQRIRDLEAAAQGLDGGTSLSLPEAIAALALEAASSSDDLDEAEDEAASESEDGGTAAAARAGTPRDGDSRGRIRVTVGGEESFWTAKGFSLWGLAFWAALFAALQLSQWVVIALSRDYHDVIAREASLLTGVKPEDDEVIPHVRLDVPWIRKKVKRRWRALMLFVVGVPAMVVLATPFLCISSGVFTVLSSAWGAWWLMVFTAAKSEHAWVPPAEPHAPWFLRAWTWLTTKVPGFRWGVLQRYGAMWSRRSGEVLAPIATVERHPWAFAGLTLVRFLGAFPPMKFFIRPLIPVASAHLLAAEAAYRSDTAPFASRPQTPAGETGA
ncbi:hypothetical protein [Pyxidicoccus trucidator]|uniref:hypothetical protein n=1 Tax=Pyxidicoccus trucidator TaxID=2709662 RepID=UPI0013DC10D0|nr:hypothetical protein [Pyxidicoccus trucidator]